MSWKNSARRTYSTYRRWSDHATFSFFFCRNSLFKFISCQCFKKEVLLTGPHAIALAAGEDPSASSGGDTVGTGVERLDPVQLGATASLFAQDHRRRDSADRVRSSIYPISHTIYPSIRLHMDSDEDDQDATVDEDRHWILCERLPSRAVLDYDG